MLKDDLAGLKGVKTKMEGNSLIMPLEETAKDLKRGKSSFYKMAREGKIPVVKIGLEKNNKVIIRGSLRQNWDDIRSTGDMKELSEGDALKQNTRRLTCMGGR